MAHKDWCGKVCQECTSPCKLWESMPCSPNCPYLGTEGEIERPECLTCEICYDDKDLSDWLSSWLFD